MKFHSRHSERQRRERVEKYWNGKCSRESENEGSEISNKSGNDCHISKLFKFAFNTSGNLFSNLWNVKKIN